MLPVAVLLLVARTAVAQVPTEVINLDLPPAERWRDFAGRHRESIIAKASSTGKAYEVGIGKEMMTRWMNAAPVSDVHMAEYKSIVRYVDDPEVTLQRLIITDMWHAVQAPTFGCTGLLMAMSNGTVIHGRNVDYDIVTTNKQREDFPPKIDAPNDWFNGILTRAGKPIASFLGMTSGGLGIHTGLRFKDGPHTGWSINSNARIAPNNITLNLLATEAGSKNFPWLIREFLEDIPDYSTLLKTVESMNVNAPNYFILAGSDPYEGAVVTKDRGGVQEPDTPPPRFLSSEQGIWELVQTNDDVNKQPLDRRRNIETRRLSTYSQSNVSEGFVLNEMKSFPVENSDTLLSWVANPASGFYRTFPRPEQEMRAAYLDRIVHKELHIPMPHEFPSSVTLAQSALEPSASPLVRRGRLRASSGEPVAAQAA